jgi:hypothetical protein
MQDIIVKRTDPVASADLIDHGLSKQAKPPGQEKAVASFSQVPLVRKPAAPARLLAREKIVGPFSRYPAVKKPISRQTLDLVSSNFHQNNQIRFDTRGVTHHGVGSTYRQLVKCIRVAVQMRHLEI